MAFTTWKPQDYKIVRLRTSKGEALNPQPTKLIAMSSCAGADRGSLERKSTVKNGMA
jgi:hypothetical protein